MQSMPTEKLYDHETMVEMVAQCLQHNDTIVFNDEEGNGELVLLTLYEYNRIANLLCDKNTPYKYIG